MGSCFSRSRNSGGNASSGPKLLGPGKLESGALLKDSGAGGSLIGGVGGGPSSAVSAGVGVVGVSDGGGGVGTRNGPMPALPSGNVNDGSGDNVGPGVSGAQGQGGVGNLAGQNHKVSISSSWYIHEGFK